MQFFSVVVGRCKWFDLGNERLWVVLRFFWVVVSRCGCFHGGSW